MLVLGNKRFGRGVIYFDDTVERKVGEWRYWAGALMRAGGRVSFDNLAIKQLDVQGWVTPEAWETMDVDAVRMECARSSVSKREPVGGLTIRDMFHK